MGNVWRKEDRLLSTNPPECLPSNSMNILFGQKLSQSKHHLFPSLTLPHPVRALFGKWPSQEGHETQSESHVSDRILTGGLLQSKHV